MRIVLVGASGTIGQAVAGELGGRHEIVAVGSRSGDVRMDITDAASIRAALAQIGTFDAIVSTAGKVKFAPLDRDDRGRLPDRAQGQADGPGQSRPGRPRADRRRRLVHAHQRRAQPRPGPLRQLGLDGERRHRRLRARGRDRAAARLADQRGQPGRAAGIDAGLRPLLPRPRAGARGAGRARLRQERRGRAARARCSRCSSPPGPPARRPRCGAGTARSRAGRRTAPPPARSPPGRAGQRAGELGLPGGHGGLPGRAGEAQHRQGLPRHLDDPHPRVHGLGQRRARCRPPA